MTLIAAMDRARDADRLWDMGAKLYRSEPWVFSPAEVAARPLTQLADVLLRSSVSQRHGQDTFAWRTICESLLRPTPISLVVETGVGDTETLLAALHATSEGGSALYPLLRGTKIATMWVRLLAFPGGATISGLETLPVAVGCPGPQGHRVPRRHRHFRDGARHGSPADPGRLAPRSAGAWRSRTTGDRGDRCCARSAWR